MTTPQFETIDEIIERIDSAPSSRMERALDQAMTNDLLIFQQTRDETGIDVSNNEFIPVEPEFTTRENRQLWDAFAVQTMNRAQFFIDKNVFMVVGPNVFKITSDREAAHDLACQEKAMVVHLPVYWGYEPDWTAQVIAAAQPLMGPMVAAPQAPAGHQGDADWASLPPQAQTPLEELESSVDALRARLRARLTEWFGPLVETK